MTTTIHCARCLARGTTCSCAETSIDLLFVSGATFHRTPQVGQASLMTWPLVADFLGRPVVGSSKDAAGAWSAALYTDNIRRKSNLVRIWALVVDVDEAGDVDRVAAVIAKTAAIVHETFSSTADKPRCRIVFRLAEPIDAAAYEAVHKVVRAHLLVHGIVADEGAKDASRVSYTPVRREGEAFRFRVTSGKPIDGRAVLAAQPPPPPREPVREVAPEQRDRYIQGALRKAADAVHGAGEGQRHYQLAREAFGLARLNVSANEIEAALMPAWIAAAGEGRRAEGKRTIRDQIEARAKLGSAA